MKVGITGQNGFIGTHLYNLLGMKEDILRIDFRREYFQDAQKLEEFVTSCDTIVHLAALNRHNDPEEIYTTNVSLVQKIISACEQTNARPHIIFSSSTQEEQDNPYGRSKRKGREIFDTWAEKVGAQFTGLVIPNVYGPFGEPFYNSVISTFCYKLTHNEEPEVHVDNSLDLIFVNELIEIIFQFISINNSNKDQVNKVLTHYVQPTATMKVSELLTALRSFKSLYLHNGEIPELPDDTYLNLFNTFRCYIPEDHFPVKYDKHEDQRGAFVEITRAETPGQTSFSVTKLGITRGNHFHTRKAERFAVIKGKAKIQLRRIGTNKVIEYTLDGNSPSYVDMPIWFTHNITNIGDDDLYTIFWVNEPYNPDDPDTYYEEV
ncbi:MAG TPA: NAD-dependent epimerase/dehydratase family protein [Bacteroidales bacterium]|nr:NAD-dependent epimerase/dehydratase family protein [Bacteroidales bacterium]